MKNAVAYIRVSTENQEEKYGFDLQKGAIEKYAAEKGYNVIAWHEEVGSGAKERPILEGIVSGAVITNPPIDAVLVYKNDRIARDTQMYFYYLYQLEKKGIKLVAVQEDMDGLDKSMENFCRSMFQFVAEMERKNITNRTTAGRMVKAQTGGYSGGRVPYGYRVEDHELVIDENEAELVKEVFSLTAQNVPISTVIRELTNKGFRARNGKILANCNIFSIKKNEPFYRGYYKYSDTQWVKGKHEPILKDGE